mgnify:CR=1 FL=1
MEKRYYIAYGSNLNIRQMRMRCPSARRIGTSELKGYELLFKGSKTGSYLTVEKRPGSSVPVGVWEVSSSDEKALDRYEGFPNFYYKKELTLPIKGIRTGKVRKRRVFVYIMHENRSIGIPSISYMKKIELFERAIAERAERLQDYGINLGIPQEHRRRQRAHRFQRRHLGL